MSDTVYGYFKAETPDGPGYVCVRLDRPPLNSQGPKRYKFTYSFCSPKDQFSRKIARKITSDRMNSTRINCTQDFYITNFDKDLHTAKSLLESSFNLIGDKPRWLKRAKQVGRYYKSKK